ncbi:sensor histidine kinase [Pseudonocardia nantongensis]|uniref:sensor histidine kinase n=1 Tax=Pseudonocardia nantongensis TaxID=1181885 RepID=UPI00397B2863
MTRAQTPTVVERFVAFCRRTPLLIDGVLAAVLFAVALKWTLEGKVPSDQRVTAVIVAILATVPVVFRRRYPVPAAVAVAAVAATGTFLLPGTMAGYLLPALVMAYSAVAYGPRWAGPTAAAVLLIGMLGPFLGLGVRGWLPTPPGYLAALAGAAVLVVVCVWLAGALRGAHHRQTEQLRERARLLEEGRRQEVRIELLAERSRISREVHDVVAHSLSGIIAQADGGQYAAQRDPQKAVEVLSGIATTGREALGDVRGLLAMLRETGPDDAPDDAGRPQPGTDDIPALVEQVRAGGLPVDLSVTGSPRETGTGPGLTAYRVVQEALTNVIKHAGPATPTHVTVGWTGDELTVRVRDEGAQGPRPQPPRGGHGLVGMRERAALHGGSVETGPHPDGGFAVRLRLPLTPVRGDREP